MRKCRAGPCHKDSAMVHAMPCWAGAHSPRLLCHRPVRAFPWRSLLLLLRSPTSPRSLLERPSPQPPSWASQTHWHRRRPSAPGCLWPPLISGICQPPRCPASPLPPHTAARCRAPWSAPAWGWGRGYEGREGKGPPVTPTCSPSLSAKRGLAAFWPLGSGDGGQGQG